MADIRIQKNKYSDSEDHIIEIIGINPEAEDIMKIIHGLLEKKEDDTDDEKKIVEFAEPDENGYMLRTRTERKVSIADIKKAISEGHLDELIKPYDEINITCLNGVTITIVCAYSDSDMARFIFKDCWDKAIMNNKKINKGYNLSLGRKHVLMDIYPCLPREWKNIIKNRKIVEEIDGKRVEYSDPLWLPSATDIFGTPKNCDWEDIKNSAQLPIFKKCQVRVKEFGNNGVCSYWLRSTNIDNPLHFYCVLSNGDVAFQYESNINGFAPGFDIGR